MKSPKVSVLMPAYNVEKYIGEAIDSVLNQTFTDFEFIIINDGSTDNTAKIIKQYAKKDKRIRFIDRQINKGFIATLNECLDNAIGEYVAKMDSDDISLPARLEKQVSFLERFPNIGMVGVGLQAFDKGDFITIHPAKVGLFDLYKTCAVTIFMARRNIIERNNLRFNADYHACEDYEFYSRFIRCADIANIQEVLYKYRWHGNNASIRYNDIQRINTQRVRQNILNFISSDRKIQENFIRLDSDKMSVIKYKLFGFLPIMKIKVYKKYKKCYLFDFLFVMKIKYKD